MSGGIALDLAINDLLLCLYWLGSLRFLHTPLGNKNRDMEHIFSLTVKNPWSLCVFVSAGCVLIFVM